MGRRAPAGDKKKANECRGIVLFEDEVSFWQDGTLYRTWAPVGSRPHVDTFGNRNTAHVFGAISVTESPDFHYQFADVFNGHTFHVFLMALCAAYATGAGTPPKLFLIIDNGSCHNLDAAGKVWLADNKHRIELHRLPPYSPEHNGIEGCWKTTRRMATHNAFHATPQARDAALIGAFEHFRATPSAVAGHVRRFPAPSCTCWHRAGRGGPISAVGLSTTGPCSGPSRKKPAEKTPCQTIMSAWSPLFPP